MKLFINEIIVDRRIRKNPTHIKELIDDIKENGQIQPITVRIDDNGSYRLVAGFRRLTAMKALGEQKIEAYVISEADEEKLLKMEISENEVRESYTRTERMEYIKRLEEIEKKKAKERQEHVSEARRWRRILRNRANPARRSPNRSASVTTRSARKRRSSNTKIRSIRKTSRTGTMASCQRTRSMSN